MFCKKCGAQVDDLTGLCPNCDKEKIEQLKQPAPAQAQKPTRQEKKLAKKQSRTFGQKVKIFFIKFLALALAAAIVAGATTGALVYFDRADIPFVESVFEKVGIKKVSDNENAEEPTTENNDNNDNNDESNAVTVQITEDMIKSEPDTSEIDKLQGTDDQAKAVENEVTKVEKAVAKGEKQAKEYYPEITEDTVDDYLYYVEDALYELQEKGSITSYERDGDSIRVELPSGLDYYYTPEIDGLDTGSGDSPTLQIATYQPCLSGYSDDLSSYMALIDQGAQVIDDEFSTYTFDNKDSSSDSNFDDTEVTPTAVVQSSKFNVILWHGHGNYSEKYGSLLVTGIEADQTNYEKYYKAIENKSLILSSSGHLMMNKDFVYNYIADGAFENSVIYLAACKSGYDSQLADAFLDKGASAVIANSETIATKYNTSMLNSFATGLAQKYANGLHYTVGDALAYAKNINGDIDEIGSHKAEAMVFGDETFSLDWYNPTAEETDRDVVLVLDTSGSMDGDPLDQTKTASHNFVDTVLQQNAEVAIVDYNSSANIDSKFTTSDIALNDCIDSMEATGGTNIEDGLKTANTMLQSSNAKKKIIVLMSDGEANEGRTGQDLIDYATKLREQGIYIYTLGFFNSLSDSEKIDAQKVMEGIASEGCHYEVDDAENLVFFFDDIANQINGTKYIYVKIACPVDVKVEYDGETLSSSSGNTRTSFGSLTYEENNGEDTEESDEDTDDTTKILRLKEGVDYDISIDGNGKGKMNYSIGFMDDNGEYTDFREFKNIAITKSTKVDTVAKVSDETVLKVDEDGDGKYDLTYKAQANGKGELVDNSFALYVVLGVTVAFVVIVLAIDIKVKVKRKRKSKQLQTQ